MLSLPVTVDRCILMVVSSYGPAFNLNSFKTSALLGVSTFGSCRPTKSRKWSTERIQCHPCSLYTAKAANQQVLMASRVVRGAPPSLEAWQSLSQVITHVLGQPCLHQWTQLAGGLRSVTSCCLDSRGVTQPSPLVLWPSPGARSWWGNKAACCCWFFWWCNHVQPNTILGPILLIRHY